MSIEIPDEVMKFYDTIKGDAYADINIEFKRYDKVIKRLFLKDIIYSKQSSKEILDNLPIKENATDSMKDSAKYHAKEEIPVRGYIGGPNRKIIYDLSHKLIELHGKTYKVQGYSWECANGSHYGDVQYQMFYVVEGGKKYFICASRHDVVMP